MPWHYIQLTGEIHQNGEVAGAGYSGAGHDSKSGRNNPTMEDVVGKGPIPRGQWTIGHAHHDPHKGPLTMRLTPIGHDMAGRDGGFMIHGNNSKNDASQGCIILQRPIREQIAQSGDTTLFVE